MLRSKLCYYSDAYIDVKETITIAGTNNDNRGNKKLTFKNNTPFRPCIAKIKNTFIDSTEDLDIVMPMHNLLEYSDNYYMTSVSFWNYYRDEINNDGNENDANENIVNNNKITRSKSFKPKARIIESTPNMEMD